MEKVKVIFRKTKDNEVIAFMPEITVNYGNIMSYMHIGQHGEASLDFYHDTKKATEAEYKALLEELQMLYEINNFIVDVKQKICYNDLRKAWRV